jgi:hypothetical protein
LKKFQHKDLDSNFIKYRDKIIKSKNGIDKGRLPLFNRYKLKEMSSATAAPLARDELVSFDHFVLKSSKFE